MSDPPPTPRTEIPKPPATPLARRLGLLLAPLAALLVYFILPDAPRLDETTSELLAAANDEAGLTHAARVVAAVGTLMAILWITEAIPIPATALLPLALIPLLTRGEVGIDTVASRYADDLIFLFMGGFMLALAMERWGLHRRIALRTILIVGVQPLRLIAGFMIASAILSMWVSNTATAVMMLPIALSVIELVREELRASNSPHLPPEGQPFPFAIALLLGVAYAASIGGVGTLIGTPPNTFLAQYLGETLGVELSFASWMPIGVPLVVLFLPIAWFVLTRVAFRVRLDAIPGGRALIRDQLRALGPISKPEIMVMTVFFTTAFLWMLRPWLARLELPSELAPLAGLSDAGIAILAAVVLFALPVDWKRGVFVLSWEQATRLPWGVLILFGGGLALATAIDHTGVAAWIANAVAGAESLPAPLLVLLVTLMIVFLTELTSNTATTATFLPILGAVSVGLDYGPLTLTVPVALAASCAFMMPVATPPNAIVFASGELTIAQMCRAGLILNLIGVALIMLVMYTIVLPFYG
ncbi:MAG: SLC13 family permease [Phycisphaerales bacterium]